MEKAGMNESNSPYVYPMLSQLLDKDDQDVKGSFKWTMVPGSKNEERHLIDILSELYGINLPDKHEIQFHKSRNVKNLTVSYGSDQKIVLELHTEYKHTFAILQIYNINNLILREIHVYDEKLKRFLFIDTNKDFEYIWNRHRPIINYLDITLDENSLRTLSEHRKLRQELLNHENKSRQITTSHTFETTELDEKDMKLWKNKRKHRYSLNIRGLILYILGEIRLEEENRKVNNKRISKVLENLSLNYLDNFPFFKYYADFKKEFDRLAYLSRIPKNFDILLLKDIARELQDQVHHASDSFLLYWITRRFSSGITKYFATASYLGSEHYDKVIESFKRFSVTKLREYQLTNIKVIQKYLSNELKELDWTFKNLKFRLDPNFSLSFAQIDHDFLLGSY
jgi:hypothetical protein